MTLIFPGIVKYEGTAAKPDGLNQQVQGTVVTVFNPILRNIMSTLPNPGTNPGDIDGWIVGRDIIQIRSILCKLGFLEQCRLAWV